MFAYRKIAYKILPILINHLFISFKEPTIKLFKNTSGMFGNKKNDILVDNRLAYCVSLTTRRHGVYINREEV
jgi:hypothetical protein